MDRPLRRDDRPVRAPGRRAVVIAAGVLAAAAAVSVPIALARGNEDVDGLLAARPFTVAHRGSALDWPEMSAYAYGRSVGAGARALDISLARSSDGVWFGLHDTTLDRTSGTVGYVAAQHPWAEIQRLRISAANTRFPTQPDRPYLRLEDFLRQFVPSSVAFIDPKGVSSEHYPELLELITKRVSHPERSVIAKSDAQNVRWATVCHAAGVRTWGFYYGSALTKQPSLLDTTQHSWDLLGLDWSATPEQWARITGLGKRVIGHVIATEAQRALVLSRGAAGVIVDDLLRVAP